MRLMRFILLAAVAIFAFVAPLELALRLVPSAIPLSLLTEFEPTLRSAIAKQRKLQRFKDMVLVPRDDGGPTLWLFKPFTRLDFEFHDTKGWVPIHLDANGFCNPPENSYDVPEIDIIVVGDSFT